MQATPFRGRRLISRATHDTTAYEICDGFMVDTAGNHTVIDEDGNTTILPGLLAGVVYPFRVSVIKTGTSTNAIWVYGSLAPNKSAA